MFDYRSFVQELKDKGVVVGDTDSGFELNPYFEMPKGLEFADVGIEQEHSHIQSRLDTNVSSEVFRGFRLLYPMIASNMMSVTNAAFCDRLSELGALGVLHRGFPTEEAYLDEARKMRGLCRAASVGVGSSQVNLASKLADLGVDIIFLDVAHGYSEEVISTGRQIKNNLGVKLIIGNAINPEFLYAVDDFADAVKVSIGNGSACETRFTAGCYVPPFTVLQRFKKLSKKLGLPVIQDGGIHQSADFVKAIAAGASSVMMGKNFAMCPESAAETIDIGGGFRKKKEYYGMASRTAQDRWRGGLKEGTC